MKFSSLRAEVKLEVDYAVHSQTRPDNHLEISQN